MTEDDNERLRIVSRALKPFTDLRPETREVLAAMYHLLRFPAGQIVSHEFEESDYVGIVRSGVLRMQKTLADGRHPIVGLLMEGDLFGCVFDGQTDLAIEAATDVEVFAFPRRPFLSLLDKSPDLDQAVLRSILDGSDRARDWMVVLSNQKIVNRVAGFLLIMCTRFLSIDHLVQTSQRGIEIKFPVRRLDLAHLLGTRPESISRALHALANAGDIEIITPDRILIQNAESLAQKAGEEKDLPVNALNELMSDREPDRS